MTSSSVDALTENELATQTEPRGVESVVCIDNNHIGITGHPDISGMQIFYDNRIWEISNYMVRFLYKFLEPQATHKQRYLILIHQMLLPEKPLFEQDHKITLCIPTETFNL